jgi:hypothetical protein
MENQEEQTTPQAAPELTITDLQNIRSIIDAASRRGAFGASEMAAIGSVFNKLDAFLNAVAPAQQAADGQPEA